MQGLKVKAVSHEELAEIVAASEVRQVVDIGVASVSVAKHPVLGEVVCVSGCDALSALIQGG